MTAPPPPPPFLCLHLEGGNSSFVSEFRGSQDSNSNHRYTKYGVLKDAGLLSKRGPKENPFDLWIVYIYTHCSFKRKGICVFELCALSIRYGLLKPSRLAFWWEAEASICQPCFDDNNDCVVTVRWISSRKKPRFCARNRSSPQGAKGSLSLFLFVFQRWFQQLPAVDPPPPPPLLLLLRNTTFSGCATG